MPDNDKADPAGEQGANFRFVEDATFLPPLAQVTSVAVVSFAADGCIVLADLPRGPDLPGGHVEADETTFAQTARREAYEEARITITEPVISSIIASDLYGDDLEQLTYMVILTAGVHTFHAEATDREEKSRGRLVMTPDAFLKNYRAADRDFMRTILEQSSSRGHG